MIMINNGFRLFSASAIVLATAFALPGVAHAQLFFDWGGGSEKVNDSGRQPVRINSDAKPGEIIVSFTDRKLYLFTAPGQAISYPVAIPREQDRWEGKTTVTEKRENPSWTPTPTMIKENPRLPRWVPGGHPMNPLGNRALYLGSSYYRIHGTDAPWTIGTAVSKGCIRMYNKDALEVYERAKIGAKVLVTWNAYQATPNGEPGQASAPDDAPAGARASGTSRRNAEREAPVAAAAAAATATAAPPVNQKSAESRYSDIFGTPEPAAPAAATRPAGESEATRSPRPARENQTQREPRKARDATVERTRAEPAATSATAATDAAGAADAAPAKPKAAEQRPRASAVETGSLPDRRAKPKTAAPEQSATPTQAQITPAVQPDAATRALEAAERAAAAAERAAAAAERAERAAAARAAAPAAASEPVSGVGND